MTAAPVTRALFAGDYHYAVGPTVALLALGALALVLRWGYGRPRRLRRAQADFGLLVAVTTVATAAQAEAARSRLAAAGIRGTVAPGPDPRTLPVRISATGEVLSRPPAAPGLQVLVFPADLDRAGAVLRA